MQKCKNTTKYPQSLFAEKLAERISKDTKQIIDAPCGDGLTTSILAGHFPTAQVLGADISEKSVKSACKKYAATNLNFKEEGIHKLIENIEKVEVFCLINSLFLLPNPKKLLKKISRKLTKNGRLFLILPNPESTNFKRYQQLFPEINTFILEQNNYAAFFKNMSLQILHCEGIVRVPIYGRWDTKLLYPVRDRYLFHLESRSLSEDYGYFLVELSKD